MPARRPHDACGVGFIADAHGRPSRAITAAALEGLANVRHRGAVAADARSSDGTGILSAIPAGLYGEGVGIALLFHPAATDVRPPVEAALAAEGLEVVGWRTPPTDDDALGELARRARPAIAQVLFRTGPAVAETLAGETVAGEALAGQATIGEATDPAPPGRWPGARADERAALRARRRLRQDAPATYVVSCSFRTVTHKGLVAADALADFWLDLADERFAVPFAVFHQRFSTNTSPSWERTQPFRTLAHNGEINTLWGNAARMAGRGPLGTEAVGLGPEGRFQPLLDGHDSDSGQLDEVVELLVRAGRHPAHAVAMLVPPAWEHDRDMAPEVRGFFAYHATLVEPWDGPAGLVFTDGVGVGAALDRNGLRPLRAAVCEDGLVVVCSEAGAVDLAGHGRVERFRLGPGHILWVDPTNGVVRDANLKSAGANRAPYARWAAEGLRSVPTGGPVEQAPDDLVRRQAAHGYTKEELAMVLKPMAEDGHEPTFSMGDDSPLPSMAGRPRPVAHLLRQRFAQVTNPPIDPLRERRVMSTRVVLGPRAALLTEGSAAARLLVLDTPLMTPEGVNALDGTAIAPFTVAHLDATVAVADGPDGLADTVNALADRAVTAVADGAALLVIDDAAIGVDRAPIPSLLALGAIHQRLTTAGRRDRASLVVVADDVRDVHAVAALVTCGADAVCPRLALQTVLAMADEADDARVVGAEAQEHLLAALETGLLKVLSKMGIATVDSYRGAQLMEAVGLGADVIDVCFTGTVSTVGGLGWRHLGEDVLARHRRAWPEGGEPAGLESPGVYRVRKGGEPHGKSKEVVAALNATALTVSPDERATSADDPQVMAMVAAHLLQRAIAAERFEAYQAFARLVDERTPLELHDLLDWVPAGPPVPLDEVEPATAIVTRFTTGAMSHGALSREAHETLAQAMNLLGARSNCGEGGEDPVRFRTRGHGRDDKNSRIKQIASGRFGVTPEYVAFADELQIKVAQGSKPGEGGQLPGHKVTAEIARLRHTQPGVGLISPPPHHDIYSIEDLAQLIYDLKQVNAAQVSVKLVAEDGVGTVAAGCAKALADGVHISGANGGTGASPLSSIKHAGLPWELGLADTQQALVAEGLRSRVRLGVDGGFMTGRQVVVAALLGADEVSFGTAVMMAEGCIMLRACHRDTCKPGVATQRPGLRANFAGTPEGVAAYLTFVAEDVRRHLAAMGARTLGEVIGRVEVLHQRRVGDERVDALDLTPLLAPPDDRDAPRHFVARTEVQDPRSKLGDQLLADAFRPVWEGDEVELAYPVTTADRAVGAALSGAIALEYGTLPPRGTATVRLTGSAGQSLGAFLAHGVEIDLVGEANDHVGKGMGGGRIVIRPPADDALAPHPTGPAPVLAGNTCLYGATGGELFIAGAAGERFAVRASGAVAVVEAVGDHCCEYQTGGTIVVLGRIGHNLGAGMTGGQAFVWDPEVERVLTRVNADLVDVLRPDHSAREELRWLVERHLDLTGSRRAALLLQEWDDRQGQLWHVVPRSRTGRDGSVAARRVLSA